MQNKVIIDIKNGNMIKKTVSLHYKIRKRIEL